MSADVKMVGLVALVGANLCFYGEYHHWWNLIAAGAAGIAGLMIAIAEDRRRRGPKSDHDDWIE